MGCKCKGSNKNQEEKKEKDILKEIYEYLDSEDSKPKEDNVEIKNKEAVEDGKQ